ncbi:MAG: hypothetical protein R3F61_02430 [Myxococcota bacterium]
MSPTLRSLALLALCACGPTTDFNGYTELTGTLTYTSRVDGEAILCDVDLDLVGTPYTGRCSDCEFAFHVDPTVVRDDSDAECTLPSLWTYVDDDFIDRSGLGYAASTATFDGRPLDRALVAVGDLEGRATSAGMIGAGTPDASVRWDDEDTLTWTYRFEEGGGEPQDLHLEGACDPGSAGLIEIDGSRDEGTFAEDQTLACDGFQVDRWTFEGRAGEALDIHLDTVGAESAFDTAFYINGPDGCTEAFSDDAYTCSFRPLEYDCAGGRFTPQANGIHTLIVMNYGKCTSPDGERGTGAYRLSFDGPSDPGLQLVADDAETYEHRVVTELSGAVMVTRDGAR